MFKGFGPFSTYDLLIFAGIGVGAYFLFFTEQGKQIISKITGTLTGGEIYNPQTSPFARQKPGGPLGLEDARESIGGYLQKIRGDLD